MHIAIGACLQQRGLEGWVQRRAVARAVAGSTLRGVIPLMHFPHGPAFDTCKPVRAGTHARRAP